MAAAQKKKGFDFLFPAVSRTTRESEFTFKRLASLGLLVRQSERKKVRKSSPSLLPVRGSHILKQRTSILLLNNAPPSGTENLRPTTAEKDFVNRGLNKIFFS